MSGSSAVHDSAVGESRTRDLNPKSDDKLVFECSTPVLEQNSCEEKQGARKVK